MFTVSGWLHIVEGNMIGIFKAETFTGHDLLSSEEGKLEVLIHSTTLAIHYHNGEKSFQCYDLDRIFYFNVLNCFARNAASGRKLAGNESINIGFKM